MGERSFSKDDRRVVRGDDRDDVLSSAKDD
jgi:hypothetical protein